MKKENFICATISEKKQGKEIVFLHYALYMIVLAAFFFIKQINSITQENTTYSSSNIKEESSNYSHTKNNYSNGKYKEPISCSPPPSQSILLTIQPIRSGLWTDNTIWPNGIQPTANDVVEVPSGIVLTMVGTCFAKSIMVNGTLNAVNWQDSGAWINLETESIMVNSGGKMEIGTEALPYNAIEKCVITLKGTGSQTSNSPDAYKSIMVMSGGTLELHGKKRKSWTNIAVTANAGATQITLKEAVDWEVGDKIALTSTELALESTKSWNHVDESEITLISADKKTLTLKSPLQYKHIGGSKSYTRARDGKKWDVNVFGEVGLLSHYIKIQGEMGTANEANGFGGHTMLMKGSISHVEHVELYKMGQKGLRGRYPYHWHLNEDKSIGSYLRNSSVHKSFNRAVTIHGTDYVTVDGVFAYDHIGHGIFLEDGGERYNTIKNNVVFVTRRPNQGEQVTPSDNFSDNPIFANTPQNRTPASYWITNPNNYFENNVAAGTEGTGFWFAFPANGPLFASRTIPYFQGLIPWKQPLGKFEGFVAHTCMNGFDVFDQLNDDHSIKANFGWAPGSKQLIQKGLFYGNDQAIYCGLGVDSDNNQNTAFSDCALSDNKTISMLAGDITIENSLFNVDTDLGVFTGTREFFRLYDGPGNHVDCHFEGWNRPNSEFIQQNADGGGGATENFNITFRGTTKGFTEPFPFRHVAFPTPNQTRARKVGHFFKDYDGGLLGKAHTTLIRDVAFNRDGHEYRHPSWKNAARSDYYFANLWLHNIGDPGVSVVRTKPGTSDACLYDFGGDPTYKFGLIVNQDFTYNYYLSKIPDSKSILLIYYRADPGDLTLVNFKGLGKLGGFKVVGAGDAGSIKRLNSKAEIEATKDLAYFIDGNGDVYLKLRAFGGDNKVNIFLDWKDQGTYTTAPLPCTTNDFNPITSTNTLPAVTFTSPTQTQYDEGTSLGVVANATDSDGTIANVKLYLNDVLLRQENASPYEWGTAHPTANIDPPLLKMVAGTYVLKAVATDNSGGSSTVTKTITVVKKPVVVQIIKRNAPAYAIDGNNGGANEQNVYLWSGSATNVNQQWIEIDRGNGYYSYKKMNTTYCIDGNNGGAIDQNVYLYTCDDTNENQHWKKVDMGSGYFRLEKRNAPGFSIDGGSGGADGQNVKLFTSDNTNQNLQWSFTTVNSSLSSSITNSRVAQQTTTFSVYPNPAIDLLTLDLNKNEISTNTIGKIYDNSGAMIRSFKINTSRQSISVKDLKPGIYLIYIEGKNKAHTTKMVKQ
jgi:G8 domain/Secretion system C-terminal sorting domain/Ricin-type beta-trefoil lectin domain-like/Bacterial Ig domain